MYNKFMKRKIFLILFIIGLLLWILSLQNVYNPLYDIILCNKEYACLHEAGHQIDARNAEIRVFKSQWTSSSKEFEEAVQTYITDVCFYGYGWIKGEKICTLMFRYPGIENPYMISKPLVKINNPLIIGFINGWGGYLELYADIYATGVPKELMEFYQ